VTLRSVDDLLTAVAKLSELHANFVKRLLFVSPVRHYGGAVLCYGPVSACISVRPSHT